MAGTTLALRSLREAVRRPKGVFLVMSDRANTAVVVVKYDDSMLSGLSRCVLKHRWDVLDGRSVPTPARQIVQTHPRVLLVQVPPDAEPALALIERLRRHWMPMVIVALACESSERSELAVRRAGASAFLGPSASQEMVENVLRQAAPGSIAELEGPREVEIKVARATGRKRKGRIDAKGGIG